MFQRKVQLLITYCLALAFILSACAGGSTNTPAAAGQEPAAAVSFMVFGDPAELGAYQALTAAFESKYPAIKIELIHIPGQADYRKRLAADFAAGKPADVVLINYRRYASLAARGALEPLGDYLASSTVIQPDDFYTEATLPFTWAGKLVCIPQNISSLVVYYNKNLFDQAGLAYPKDDWSWDDFVAAALALTKDLDGDGVTDQYGLGTEASLFRLAPFIWQNGSNFVDSANEPTRLILDEPLAFKATQWFVELQTKHHVVPNQEAESAEDSESRFQNGRLGMFLNSRRGVPTYREITAFDWDVAALPRKYVPAGILHADGYCMPASAAHKDLVWKFIEYANSPEGQTIVAKSGRTVPSLRSVAESPAFLDPSVKPANSRVFLDTIAFVRAVPVMETWVDIESIVGEELERAFYGNAALEEAVQAAIDRTQIYFKEETK